MTTGAVRTSTDLPAAYGPTQVVRFFPEYTARHPLWCAFGQPELGDLRLPADLAARLRRWSAYWDGAFRWDEGWPVGAPESWWSEEEDRLPRDVALAFGADFVVEAGGRHLHSTTAAAAPAGAAALHALVDAEAAERAGIEADIAGGARYVIVAGGTEYTGWLAERERSDAAADGRGPDLTAP